MRKLHLPVLFAVLLLTALLAAGCGGKADTVAGLEQRIAELESQSAIENTASTVVPSSTVPSTTTTKAPTTTTTTTLLQADWESLSAQDIHGWIREDGAEIQIPDWVLQSTTASCEGAVQGFSTMGQLLGKDSIRVLGIVSDAEEGLVSVDDAKAALEEYGQSAIVVGEMADQVIQIITDRNGILEVGQIGQAASSVGLSALSFAVFVFDLDSGEIDREAMSVWLPGLATDVQDLLTKSALSEGICSG